MNFFVLKLIIRKNKKNIPVMGKVRAKDLVMGKVNYSGKEKDWGKDLGIRKVMDSGMGMGMDLGTRKVLMLGTGKGKDSGMET